MFTLTHFKFSSLQLVFGVAIAMVLAIFVLGHLKGGVGGLFVVALEVAYLVIGGAILLHLKHRWGSIPAVVASPAFWGWILTTVVCFVWAVIQYIW